MEGVQVQERCTRVGAAIGQMRVITHDGGHGRTNYNEPSLELKITSLKCFLYFCSCAI